MIQAFSRMNGGATDGHSRQLTGNHPAVAVECSNAVTRQKIQQHAELRGRAGLFQSERRASNPGAQRSRPQASASGRKRRAGLLLPERRTRGEGVEGSRPETSAAEAIATQPHRKAPPKQGLFKAISDPRVSRPGSKHRRLRTASMTRYLPEWADMDANLPLFSQINRLFLKRGYTKRDILKKLS